MGEQSERDYLRGAQYRDSSNLDARIALHRRFSANPESWHRWVFTRAGIHPGARVLELGCGPGDLWMANLERLPEGVSISLCDLSAGMVNQASARLAGQRAFRFLVGDAAALPFTDQSFDIAIANHMLYHVPEIPAALKELNRVLAPGGKLYTATNGVKHMEALNDLLRENDPDYRDDLVVALHYSLENAQAYLDPLFSNCEREIYPDELHVTDPKALVAYIRSTRRYLQEPDGPLFDTIRNIVQAEITSKGYFLIQKSLGMVKAHKSGSPKSTWDT